MPAQISHIVFAEESLSRALGAEGRRLIRRHGNLFRFGAQGPDFFFHNQRTRPTGLKYGVNAHRDGYGRLVARMLAEVRRLQQRSRARPQGAGVPATNPLEGLRVYLMGFITHAFLDRKTHPFVNYFAGWVDPQRPETQRYFRCHMFLERILDVLLLERRRGEDVRTFSLPGHLDCGARLPYPVLKTLLKGLNASYPRMHYKSRDRQRIENAYADSMAFYVFTDPADPQFRPLAVRHDLEEGRCRRRLALFHPYRLPQGVDFLNLRHRSWCHPCREDWVYSASFLQLYEEALEEAAAALLRLPAILEEGDLAEVEALVGNSSLGTGLPWKESPRMRFCDPLPLPEILDDLYRDYQDSRAALLPS